MYAKQRVKIEGLLLITNTRTGQIIYNFANPALGYNAYSYETYGSQNPDVLHVELMFDMSANGMLDDDPYQMWAWVDDDTLEDTRLHTGAAVQLLQQIAANLATPDGSGRARVILEGTNNINTVSGVTTVTTVSTVNTVSGLTSLGIYNATPVVPYGVQVPIEIQMQKIVIT